MALPFHKRKSFEEVNIVVHGNSISTGTFGTSYLDQLIGVEGLYNFSPTYTNVSEGGKQTQDMIDEAEAEIDPLLVSGKINILIAWEVTNEISGEGVGVETAVANLKTYCNARRTAGWTVITLTCLPRINVSDPTYLLPANELIRETWPDFCDGLIDVRTDSRLGVLNDTYYADDIHTNTAGNGLIRDLILKKLRDMYGIVAP